MCRGWELLREDYLAEGMTMGIAKGEADAALSYVSKLMKHGMDFNTAVDILEIRQEQQAAIKAKLIEN